MSIYQKHYEQLEPHFPGGGCEWLTAARKRAFQQFEREGFPSNKQEEWKYTQLNELTKAKFTPVIDGDVVNKESIAATLPKFDCYSVIFVNGKFQAEASNIGAAGDGVEIKNLAGALDNMPELVEPFLKEGGGESSFDALNAALTLDGAVVHVRKGAKLDKPIFVLYFTDTDSLASHPRNLIIAEEASDTTIVEYYAGNANSYWTNVVTQLHVAENARVQHYKWQAEAKNAYHIASTKVTLENKGHYENFVLSTGAAVGRNDVLPVLHGSDVVCKLGGLYLARDNQQLDHYVPVTHSGPQSASSQHYRGVLDGAAKGIFYGQIIVPPEAVKTDAHQLNKNLLLSDKAEAVSRPDLEIETDDVQCSHGSATGDIDKDALFYLCARGLSEKQARALLIKGFIAELLEDISNEEVRGFFEDAIETWLNEGGE